MTVSSFINYGSLGDVKDSLDTIASFFNYLMHPTKIVWTLWNWTVEMSFLVCLLICLASVLLYILGHKKFAKWATSSIVFYTIIQAINSNLRG